MLKDPKEKGYQCYLVAFFFWKVYKLKHEGLDFKV